MVKIFALSVLHAPPSGASVLLATAQDLSVFSFYQKGAVGEFLGFLTRTVAERTPAGQRQSVREGNYAAHVYNRGGVGQQLVAVIITDQEYPVRPAFSLLAKIMDEFTLQVPQAQWATTPNAIQFPQLAAYLAQYQDPRQADPLMRVQAELDETKIVLHKTIESVLERGERLDILVDRSINLSAQSKVFYKTAHGRNSSCCVVM
ncbi:snare protein YKT6 [Mycena filopes]|nr:snare protein YKT6 [Mycena filopes]